MDFTMRCKIFLKYAAYAVLFTAWLMWDLHQAYGDKSVVYQSYEPAFSASVTTPAAATVAIVRSNDPALAHPWSVTDDRIGEETIAQMVRRAV